MSVLPQRGTSASAALLNGRGLIVGTITVNDPLYPSSMGNECCWRAVTWQHGRIAELGRLGGREAVASAVNERGQIVGHITTRNRGVHAVLWEDGKTVDLGHGVAVDINDAGMIVGIDNGGGFVWTRGIRSKLGFTPTALNDRGEVVGYRQVSAPMSWPTDSKVRPFYWRSGRAQMLPTLRGFASSSAETINPDGEIAGLTMTANGDEHLVLWRGARMRDLGVIGRGRGVGHISLVEAGRVFANRSGQIAVSTTGDVAGGETYGTGAFLFDNGSLHRLSRLRQIDGLNDRGQIIGTGRSSALVYAAGRITSLPGPAARPAAINNTSVIVGASGNHPVIWRPTSSNG